MNKVKATKGHIKMLRYIEDLVRNKNFRRLLKRLKKAKKAEVFPQGTYNDWTPEQKKEHDRFNNEASSIIDDYNLLRKRCNRLLRDRDFVVKEQIASNYGLDNSLAEFALAKLEKKTDNVEFAWFIEDDVDMCRITNLFEAELAPYNPGEEIIYLNTQRQLSITAFPVAVAIHPRAAKRDVLDFIEQKWKWIDSALSYSDEKRVLKIRKRKHSQEMIDFIWETQSLPAKKIKQKLDTKFPGNKIAYFEISKLIQVERERRYRKLT